MTIRLTLLLLTLAGILVSWRRNETEWNLYQAIIFVLFALAILGWALHRLKLQWTWAFTPLLAIGAWTALQLTAGLTVYPNATIVELLRWTTYAAIFALAFWLFRHRDEITWLLRILIIFSLLLAAVSTMQHFAGNGKIFWLFDVPGTLTGAGMGPFLNHDHYASYMALIIPMAMLRAFDEPKHRITYILAAAAMYASVIAGTSRAGSLLVTAEILLCLFLIAIRPGEQMSAWQRHRVALASIFLIATLVAVVGWEPLWNRFLEPDPYKYRRELASSSLAMIREKPLTGFGAGTWTSVYPAYAIFDPGAFANAAHNDWLQWGADGGIPFAGLFFVLFCISLGICWRVHWAIGIPAVFIHCMVDFPIGDGRYFPAIFFLIFGAALARSKRSRRVVSAKTEGAGAIASAL
jgi:O-antigen ligase